MNFFSRGKLLISGEYLVLKGAWALAAPVNFGQSMTITDRTESGFLDWESYENDFCWFRAKINIDSPDIVETSDQQIAEQLLRWILQAQTLNPGFLKNQSGKKVVMRADFKMKWGLGSSSSLLSNIAWWADIDSYQLHKKVSKGSGYDVVCAREDEPVLFRKKEDGYEVNRIDFNPPFKSMIYFIYLGKKQNSSNSVELFLRENKNLEKETELISGLGLKMAKTTGITDFEDCMQQHEQIISGITNVKRLKKTRFNDLKGEIKSLGAWGGDFAMMTWHESFQDLKKYLETKNIDTVFSFSEMIKTR